MLLSEDHLAVQPAMLSFMPITAAESGFLLNRDGSPIAW